MRRPVACAICSRTICCNCSPSSAMDPPVRYGGTSVRDRKADVLKRVSSRSIPRTWPKPPYAGSTVRESSTASAFPAIDRKRE